MTKNRAPLVPIGYVPGTVIVAHPRPILQQWRCKNCGCVNTSARLLCYRCEEPREPRTGGVTIEHEKTSPMAL